MPDKPSQLQFKRNSKGQKYLVYTEDMVTKANDGGLRNMKSDRKIVWVYPSSNMNHCPVCLVEKYLSLCPRYYLKPKFYLQSLQKLAATRWYAGQVVGQTTLGKVIKTMLHNAKLEGYFTGHSLRCSGITRLFQAGVDKKIIKEMSGHKSDAVDCYAVTSKEQQAEVSKILGSKPCTISASTEANDTVKSSEVVNEQTNQSPGEKVSEINVKCGGENKSENMNSVNVGKLVSDMIEKNSKKGKTVIKIEIEITHD